MNSMIIHQHFCTQHIELDPPYITYISRICLNIIYLLTRTTYACDNHFPMYLVCDPVHCVVGFSNEAMHFCCSSQQGLPLLGALEELLPTDKTIGGGEGRGGGWGLGGSNFRASSLYIRFPRLVLANRGLCLYSGTSP